MCPSAGRSKVSAPWVGGWVLFLPRWPHQGHPVITGMGVWQRRFHGDSSAKQNTEQKGKRSNFSPTGFYSEWMIATTKKIMRDSSNFGFLPLKLPLSERFSHLSQSRLISQLGRDMFCRRARWAHFQLLQKKLCNRSSESFLNTVRTYSSIPALKSWNVNYASRRAVTQRCWNRCLPVTILFWQADTNMFGPQKAPRASAVATVTSSSGWHCPLQDAQQAKDPPS